MADYSKFPFDQFTNAEVFALMRESRELGDEEFVNACRDAIRLKKTMDTDGLTVTSEEKDHGKSED
jgi:hypothetical protein